MPHKPLMLVPCCAMHMAVCTLDSDWRGLHVREPSRVEVIASHGTNPGCESGGSGFSVSWVDNHLSMHRRGAVHDLVPEETATGKARVAHSVKGTEVEVKASSRRGQSEADGTSRGSVGWSWRCGDCRNVTATVIYPLCPARTGAIR